MTKKVDDKTKTKKVLKEETKEIKKEDVVKKEDNFLRNIIELVLIIVAIVVILVRFPNTVVWNIVVLLLILTTLVFVHEFGHFIVAKKCGVHVHEFALGMGPKVLGFKRKNDPTDYTLRLLPIGGYCQMAGEEGEDDDKLPKDKFMCNKSKLQRTLILVAGVTMNFITAIIILFIIAFCYGSTETKSYIGLIEPDSPAEAAGLKVGDRIVECNGYKIRDWDTLTIVTNLKNKKDYYEYVVEHKDGKRETYKLVPDTYVLYNNEYIKVTDEHTLKDILKENNIKEEDAQVSKLIGVGASTEVRKGFKQAISYAFSKFGSFVSTMLLVVWSLITGKLGMDSLAGPVGMYSIVGEVAKFGFENILYLMAYLSVNLGVINILPFPAFDGGRVVFVGIEAITGKKVDARIEGYFHTIGFILLMILMLYITFQDVIRLF